MPDSHADHPESPKPGGHLSGQGGSAGRPRTEVYGPEAYEDSFQLTLVKDGQRFVFRYAPGEESRLLEGVVELVRDPKSHIDWFDAACLSHKLGEQMREELQRLLKPA